MKNLDHTIGPEHLCDPPSFPHLYFGLLAVMYINQKLTGLFIYLFITLSGQRLHFNFANICLQT